MSYKSLQILSYQKYIVIDCWSFNLTNISYHMFEQDLFLIDPQVDLGVCFLCKFFDRITKLEGVVFYRSSQIWFWGFNLDLSSSTCFLKCYCWTVFGQGLCIEEGVFYKLPKSELLWITKSLFIRVIICNKASFH